MIPKIYYSKYIDINYIGANLSKDVRKKKNCTDFYLVAHQTHARPAPCRRSLPRSPAQARSSAQIFFRASAAPLRRRPATEGQSQSRRRRRRLPLPPLASRLAPSPPSSAHRPATLRTHLPLPSRLCCNVGARPAAQGGRALAPPVVSSLL